MKNVCVVGNGSIGPVHIKAVEKCTNANLYALCDIDNKKHCDNLICYTDFDEMLKDANIDSVHICTPHYLHFDMIKKALDAGKQVVCEKPVTMTKKEFDELLSLNGASDVCVVFQNRVNPCITKMKEIIDSGCMGKVVTAKGILTWFRTYDYYNSSPWRGKLATEGGGVLINQAVHTLDYFSYLVGNVKSVKAITSNFSLEKLEVEDTVSAHLKFENGATGVFYATNSYGENSAPYFEIKFEKGVIRYIDYTLYKDKEPIEYDYAPVHEKSYWGNSHGALVHNFYDNNTYFSPFDVQNTMNTMFAIYESASNGGAEVLC